MDVGLKVLKICEGPTLLSSLLWLGPSNKSTKPSSASAVGGLKGEWQKLALHLGRELRVLYNLYIYIYIPRTHFLDCQFEI